MDIFVLISASVGFKTRMFQPILSGVSVQEGKVAHLL